MKSTTTTKLCSRCGPLNGPKPLAAFDRDSRSLDDHRSLCKQCRKEERLTQTQPRARQASPNGTPWRAKKHWSQAKTNLVKGVSGLWLGLLFIGGFGWSSLNGAFAFLETARIFSKEIAYVAAFIAASVLTLGTALSAHWSVKFARLRKAIPALQLLVIFALIQSLNLVVNTTGVKKRLALVYLNEVEEGQQTKLQAIENLKKYYQSVIDKYPLFNQQGQANTWKQEHTRTVKAAQDSLTKVQDRIATLRLSSAGHEVVFDQKIVVAWLVLPELCMLASILVFSIGLQGSALEIRTNGEN